MKQSEMKHAERTYMNLRHSERTWYVLPKPRRMMWRLDDRTIEVTVMAFSFDDDTPVWLTTNSNLVSGSELMDCAQ